MVHLTPNLSLEVTSSFFAGLSRKLDESCIYANLATLSSFCQSNSNLLCHATNNISSVSICNKNSLIALFENAASEPTVWLTSYFGNPIVFSAVASSYGIRIAFLYQRMSDTYASLMIREGVRLAQIHDNMTFSAVLKMIQMFRSDNYHVVLMFDALGKSRSRIHFLGYEVSYSNLPFIVIKKLRLKPVLVLTDVLNESELGFSRSPSSSMAMCNHRRYSGI